MNFINFILLAVIITEFYMGSNSSLSGLSRGGGSRSGGSRGGGSRIGGSRGGRASSGGSRSTWFRSGGSGRTTNIRYYRYNSWTKRHGYAHTFRYSTASSYYIKTGVITGLIIISEHQRNRFDVNRISSYSGISICYNDRNITQYDLNITQSPWFMCPWNDPGYRYCCGDEFEQRCCRYFDRRGHLAGLIIGIIIFIPVFGSSYKFFCKSSIRREHTTKIVCNRAEPNIECPLYITQMDICPLYPPSIPVTEDYPQYSLPPIISSYPADSFSHYPVISTGFVESIDVNEYNSSPSSSNNNNSVSNYSLTQEEKPPPSYSDVMSTRLFS